VIADLNPRSTFGSFVVGKENGLAAAAARAVAENPGAVYNPLCITGGKGIGKTHLLMAIAQEIEGADNRFSVEYFTPDSLSEAYHAAMSAGQGDAFRNRLRDTDILLVDDLHVLTHQSDIQAELLRILNELTGIGKQVVVASNRTPKELEGVDPEFVARIADGLVVSVGAPDYETRLAILVGRSEERGSEFEAGVLEAVAGYEIADVRELIGVLNRLVALQALSETPLTEGAARALYEGEVSSTHGTGAAGEISAEEQAQADEFADFLSGVTDTVKWHVDMWESRLNQVVKLWAERGFCTDRLASLAHTGSGAPIEDMVKAFERDAEELQALRASVLDTDPALADSPAFFDPDRLVEAREMAEQVVVTPPPLPGPSNAWTLQGFIGSWANAIAVEAVKEVVTYPGYEQNPLVLVGSTGVGKTHLLHATGNALVEALKTPVVCLTAEDLSDGLEQAQVDGTVDQWHKSLAVAPALLIDDLHLVGGNDRLQRELESLFTEILNARRQLVLTLNAEPEVVPGLNESITALLRSGVVSTLAPPDRELRKGLVAKLLQVQVGSVDPTLADYLADRPADSVRAVAGTVGRVVDEAESRGVAATAALARELVEGVASESAVPSRGVRTSGVVVTPASSVRSPEKVIWIWPDPSERLIEELS